MSINYLLDSSVLIFLLKQDSVILKHVVDVAPANFYVSAVALGELYYGAEHSVHVEKSLSQVDDLSRTLTVLQADLIVAKRYMDVLNMNNVSKD